MTRLQTLCFLAFALISNITYASIIPLRPDSHDLQFRAAGTPENGTSGSSTLRNPPDPWESQLGRVWCQFSRYRPPRWKGMEFRQFTNEVQSTLIRQARRAFPGESQEEVLSRPLPGGQYQQWLSAKNLKFTIVAVAGDPAGITYQDVFKVLQISSIWSSRSSTIYVPAASIDIWSFVSARGEYIHLAQAAFATIWTTSTKGEPVPMWNETLGETEVA